MKKIIVLGLLASFWTWEAKAVIKLNQTFSANGFAGTPQFANSDNKRVAFFADPGAVAFVELFGVDYTLGPSSVTNLSAPLVMNGNVVDFLVSPDGNRAVFRSDKDTDDVFELYSVSMTGGAITKLNSALVANGDILANYQISPDSARVVYRADQDTDGIFELYSAQIAATGSTKLNNALVAGGNVFSFQISSDSARVVYLADQDTDTVNELYSAQIAATGSTKLNSALVANGDVAGGFQISADS
ncbi:MAG: hypothetical protein K1X66_09210, partial [Verrucomicrobiae bacterium]|nr:hypothetical protein [Verrucomicrobiae bacterium]